MGVGGCSLDGRPRRGELTWAPLPGFFVADGRGRGSHRRPVGAAHPSALSLAGPLWRGDTFTVTLWEGEGSSQRAGPTWPRPIPASRAKLTMLNTMSKIRGQVKNPGYPQSEGLLGECMTRHGKELGGESNFGDALLDAGESMKRLAEVKDSLDIEVKQNFIDPLQNLCDKDLKEIQHHLKKLEGRRLDFDYKKKRQGKISDEELRQAMEKFEESKEVAETSMHNLLETDIEQVSQLSALVDAQLDYHRQAVQILEELAEKLKRRMREASSRPKREYKPKPRETYDLGELEQSNGGFPCTTAPKITASSSFRSSDKPVRTPSRNMPPLDQPSCKALYDFEPENDGELGFREGDVITLTNQIDENWYEGMLNGQSGFFPLSYVEVLVPLPQ
ncbi:endophilin-A2 isoform 1-T1 [Trichechus inunguis]